MDTILITGGNGLIGKTLIEASLKKERCVITTSRNKDKMLDDNPIFTQPENGELHVIEVDFMQPDALSTIYSYLDSHKLNIHCIIHNARNVEFLKIEADTSINPGNFQNEFYLDVTFPYLLGNLIKKQSYNTLNNIIFISSMYGIVAPNPSLYENFHAQSPIHYGVSKAAQIHLVKELAVRYAPEIRVNCVSFGGIRGRASEAFIEKYRNLNPQGRMMEKEDVAGPIELLISEASENMTGQNLVIDGGWTIW